MADKIQRKTGLPQADRDYRKDLDDIYEEVIAGKATMSDAVEQVAGLMADHAFYCHEGARQHGIRDLTYASGILLGITEYFKQPRGLNSGLRVIEGGKK